MLDVTLNDGNIATYKRHRLQVYSVCCKKRFRNDLHFGEICIQTSYDQNIQLILKSYLPVVYGTTLRHFGLLPTRDLHYLALC
jgi:hypothetical protein